MDNQQVTLPTLLDLSAAFDCADHDVFLSRLQSSFGLGGMYHPDPDPDPSVVFNGSHSIEIMLLFGVLQGSV